MAGPETPHPKPTYSRAFEAFVPDGNDLVGLLAYALYKAHIREAFLNQQPVYSGADRSPTKAELRAFRGEAERRLSVFADSIIDQATPDIERNGLARTIEASRDTLIAEMTRRTNTRTAIATNLVAWLISIAITVLVVLSGIPGWVAVLATQLGGRQ